MCNGLINFVISYLNDISPLANAATDIKKLIGHYSDEVLFNVGIASLGCSVKALSNDQSNDIAQFYWTIATETKSLSLCCLLKSRIGHIHLPDLKVRTARLDIYRFIVRLSHSSWRRGCVKFMLVVEKMAVVLINRARFKVL